MPQPLSPLSNNRATQGDPRAANPPPEELVANGLRALERERDEARAQLEQTQQKFVEVATVLRQRDAAVQSAERTAERLREVEAKLNRISRERNDAQRQRDDALRQRDDAKRGGAPGSRDAAEGSSQLADIQRQVVSIRLARDSSQAQNRELTTQLEQVREELAELGYARDTALQEAQTAREEAEQSRNQLQTLTGELSAIKQQLRNLENASEAARAGTAEGVNADLAAVQRELLALSEERDGLRDRLGELESELEKRQVESTEGAASENLQQALAEANSEREMQAIREQELLAHAGTQEEQLARISEELAYLQVSRDEAVTSLAAAQKQIEHIIRERDAVRQQGIDQAIAMESELVTLRAQVTASGPRTASNEKALDLLLRERDEMLPKLAQFERQRLQMIDLAAELDAAKRDVLKLSADVAEARLQTKSAQVAKYRPRSAPASPRKENAGSGSKGENTGDVSREPGSPLQGTAALSDDMSIPGGSEASAAEIAGRHELATMKHCFQTFTKSPGDTGLLCELHGQIEAFSEHARISGYVALHRLSSAFAGFVLELHKFPELLNQASFRTVNGTIDFLGVLLKQKDYTALKDPATALVYVLDDEADNCQAISLGLETVMLRTQCAQDPIAALVELEQGRFDLIFLDVSMPQMSGFEVCQQLRQTPMHARTPIVFLTGMTTVENRVHSSLSGGNDMLGKPFNLAELSLKALTLILRSSLNME